MLLSIETTTTDGVGIVSARGEVDLSTADSLRTAIEDTLAAGHARVVVDLTDVEFIDSAGLGVLANSHKNAENTGTAFVVVTDRQAVLRPLEITKLVNVLNVHPTLEAALADSDQASTDV
jgi:anti-sigma B factor antagonist